jgi:hypothetical protein
VGVLYDYNRPFTRGAFPASAVIRPIDQPKPAGSRAVEYYYEPITVVSKAEDFGEVPEAYGSIAPGIADATPIPPVPDPAVMPADEEA